MVKQDQIMTNVSETRVLRIANKTLSDRGVQGYLVDAKYRNKMKKINVFCLFLKVVIDFKSDLLVYASSKTKNTRLNHARSFSR